ncbi:MAG: peptidase T [Bacteroidales bacterium]|nr:peptidase T [Muribaculaceae bacterium]MCI6857356.1 peptidase T [Bacteroidales bacterium]MDY4942774.1 peptidase T [Candidatus Limisoma sp.]MDD7603988.1 peptidase T [Bacteroidales bacterium]MDD7759855.1 peptidase T [Bacteroidales bacterium]
MNVLDRFLGYVKYDTQSDELTNLTPSTPGQMVFAQALEKELKSLGLKDITLDDNGYLMATLPSNTDRKVPTVGFIAHLDTSPDMSGRHVNPRIVENYDGGNIVLDADAGVVLSVDDFPELKDYVGERLVVTDGKTLLGADDKAGVAEIITAVEYLLAHPEIKHGDIRIGFNPDEEIGLGAHKFDVARFGADFAYTMDGGAIGELEYENFNAASAKVVFKGRNVHPGYAKHKMINSIRIANQFIIMLPRWETPEHTEDYEGFYHLIGVDGSVEETTLTYIIRDHDMDRFERRKKELEHLVRKTNNEFPGCCTIEIKDQYYNMREKIEPVMFIVDIAKQAMVNAGVTPKVQPIRGGTDGAQLSFKGLPCPNIFAGGLNFHGRYEYVPVSSMEKATDVIIEICKLVEQR